MQQHMDLNQLSLCEALIKIEKGETSVRQIVDACYNRIEEREEKVGAWQYLVPREEYIKKLVAHEHFYKNSILKGLPVGIKDIIDTKGMPTEMGSEIHKARFPLNDATCVSRLKQLGAVVMGKTVTTEFAYFRPGKTANPHNLKHTPGGSSSGSAAAVADYMVPVSLGSQTAASVIRPAAYCGVTGYVATRGEMSLRGVQPLAQSLDSLGMFARNTADIRLLRKLFLADDLVLPEIPSDLKFIQVTGSDIGDCTPEMDGVMEIAASTLREKGCVVLSGSFNGYLKQLVELHSTIMAFEAARNMTEERESPEKLSVQFSDLLETGLKISYQEYLNALTRVDEIETWLVAEFGDAVAFLAPASPGAAPEGLSATGAPHMSRPWQVLGRPVVSTTIAKNDLGLPLSIQLVGKRHQDDLLLAVNEVLAS
ncbi:MAG: amidase [Methylocystaceae bacterium]|nr:amidase [Methylocystaceae bacterium]